MEATPSRPITGRDIPYMPPAITAAEKVAFLRSILPPADESPDGDSIGRRRPISSAEKIAFHRALFSRWKNPYLRNPDDLAHLFLRGSWRLLYRMHRIVRPLVLLHCPMTGYYHVARTKHIDALLRQSIREGIGQFVILGAGNDTRPIRFSGELSTVRVFELDFPATQERKKRCLKNALGRLPDGVNFVPIDFNAQDVMEVLVNSGFDPGLRTFFNWEGVCYFIAPDAADRILSLVSRTALGSSIVFDYVSRSLLEDDANPDGVTFRHRQQRYGEPIRCGIRKGGTAAYVQRFGLRLLSDLDHRDLDRLYLSGPDGRPAGNALPHFRIAHARVSPTPRQREGNGEDPEGTREADMP